MAQVLEFKKDLGLNEDNRLDASTYQILHTEVLRRLYDSRIEMDNQLQKALELISE